MADIIECPQCRRKLRLEDSVVGQTVQCPACQNTFVARPQAPEPTTPYRPIEREEPRRDDEPPRRRDDGRRRGDDDDDSPRPPRYRNGYDTHRPHRGSTVQTLGILALVFCWMPLVCLILSIS